MRRVFRVTCAIAMLAAAGCGGSDSKSDAPIGAVDPSRPAATGEATAEQVAGEMRGNVKCPARASTPRPEGAPIDDVVGVRPGMGWNEAATFVLCDNPLMVVAENTGRNYQINTYGQKLRQGFDGTFAKPRKVMTSRDYLREMSEEASRRSGNAVEVRLLPGQSRFYVSTMGLPGNEQVISVAREEFYAEGKQPTMESVSQALMAKYGPPSESQDTGRELFVWWEYDTAGNKMKNPQCRISVGPDAGTSLSTACGITVGAYLRASNTNQELAHSLAVTSQNGAFGYELIRQTESALKAGDTARKAKEVEDASKNTGAPKL